MLIRLKVPPSTNNLFASAGNKRVPTKQYMAWRTEAGWQLNLARVIPFGKMPVEIVLTVPRKPTSRDVDNFCKAPLDLLKTHGVIADDKYIERLVVERHDDADLLVSIIPFTPSRPTTK